MLRLTLYPDGGYVYLAPHAIQSVQASPNGKVSLVQTSGGLHKAAHAPEEIVLAQLALQTPFWMNDPRNCAYDVATQQFIDLRPKGEVN